MQRLAFLAAVTFAAAGAAAPPPGQSAYLHGMHDIEAQDFLRNATDDCDKGWAVDLRYIGKTGTPPGIACHDGAVAAGISIIQRLDVSGQESFPHNAAEAEGYANAFQAYARQCSNTHVWIVGNEPNVTTGQQNPDTYADAYAEAYVRAFRKVHALPGHENDLLLVAPASPYSPYCICSMHKIIQRIKAKGVTPNGFSIHPYTQAAYPADFGQLNGLLTSEQKSANNDGCGYPFRWHFRIYRDLIAAIEQNGLTGAPVFITETGNVCAPQQGNVCYPNQDVGYFQAMLREVEEWNATQPTKIRAVAPYRWTPYGDGSGRDQQVGNRPGLLADLTKAMQQKHRWTTPRTCPPPPPQCQSDDACDGRQVCDLSSGKCVATPACKAGGVCEDEKVCRMSSQDCVPASRGTPRIELPKGPVLAGEPARFRVNGFATKSNGRFSLTRHGDGRNVPTQQLTEGEFQATFTQSGTYRAVFQADPSDRTYAIAYLNVGATPASTEANGDPTSLSENPNGVPSSVDGVPGGPSLQANGSVRTELQTLGGCACSGGADGATAAQLLGLLLVLARRRSR